eukprot:CAMPEP_0179312698 /NCGR_PEP_ID=MMETSP0797-20121207/53412_1 /TAXON_ID=47934 /ORGANISM="Dinophysis acuminata, Strain DAEP01" /LENGTH=183 /DNA_ID=CAMNT_0021022663 /DNA_START=36 /DNA_END=583 /DNA_ORIENTATION=-
MTSIVPAMVEETTTLDELRSGALAARKARNSLRHLLATLAATPRPDHHNAGTGAALAGGNMVDAIRAKAQQDLRELRRHSAMASLTPATQESLPAVGACGIKPRQQARQGAVFDLAPRMRLRLEPGVHVLAVAMSMPECGRHGDAGAKPGGAAGGGCVAVILSTGCVEIWERDPFCWHHASTA